MIHLALPMEDRRHVHVTWSSDGLEWRIRTDGASPTALPVEGIGITFTAAGPDARPMELPTLTPRAVQLGQSLRRLAEVGRTSTEPGAADLAAELDAIAADLDRA